jgi:DNA-directed RNA polymerase sigma subunit (sigma70/sigma32)
LENAAIEKLSHVMNRGTRVSSSGVQESVQDDDEYALISIGLPQPKVRLIQEMRKNVTRMAAQRCNGEDPVSLARRHTAVELLFLTLSAWDGVLNDEEQQILSSIYLAPEPKTESVLGEELSLSPSTVNNRKKQAIDKLARAIIEAMAG